MRKSVVKAKLKAGLPVLGVCLHLTDASLHEIVGLMGFDFIWLDMEHHGYSVETAHETIRASRVGRVDVMARPAKGEFMRAGRMLEAGAHGIMYPRCSNAAEARELVRWTKFAPMGERGFDGGNPDMPYVMMDMAEYVKMANEENWNLVQIEDPAALEQVDEIAAVPGVDIIILGPADFTVLSGIPGQFNHKLVQKAIEKIAAAAKKHGKAWGMPSGSPERCKELMQMGAQWHTCGADIVWVKNALEAAQKNYGPLGFTFNNSAQKGASYMEKA